MRKPKSSAPKKNESDPREQDSKEPEAGNQVRRHHEEQQETEEAEDINCDVPQT
jgi:hypothetical protein